MIGTGKAALIAQVINGFNRDNDNLVDQLLSILYYYRGAITREEVWQLTPYEREKSIEFLNKRFKDAGDLMKKGVSVFI